MAGNVLAKRYAQAAFDLAVEHGDPEGWEGSLADISQAFESEEFGAFLENAKIPLEKKSLAIEAAFTGAEPLLLNLLSLMVAKGIATQMPDLLVAYRQLLDQYRGREQAEVFSAVTLEDGERQHVVSFLEELAQVEVVLQSRVDPSILGGLVIRIGNKLIDGSSRSKLRMMSDNLKRDVSTR